MKRFTLDKKISTSYKGNLRTAFDDLGCKIFPFSQTRHTSHTHKLGDASTVEGKNDRMHLEKIEGQCGGRGEGISQASGRDPLNQKRSQKLGG